MSVTNNQMLFQGGAMMRLAEADSNWLQVGGWRDIGSVNIIVPNNAPTKISARDSRNGRFATIEERVIEFVETFDFSTLNCSLENQAFLFGGAVETYSQTAGTFTDREHKAWPDSIVPLLDANGDFMYDVATITGVLVGATSKTEGTDWIADEYMLKRGYIHIPAGSTITANSTILVSGTTNVIASSKRLIRPHTSSVQRVLGQVLWTDGGNDLEILARDMFRATVSGTTPALSETDYSRINGTVKVIEDLTSTRPAGRFLHPIGAVPTIALP
jgi:hypothetical protein